MLGSKNLPANTGDKQVWSLGQEDPLEEGMTTHSSILTWRIPMDRSLAGYSPWVHKELDTTEWLNHAQCTTWLYKYFLYILLSILLGYVLFYPLSTYVIGINGRRKVNCFNEWKNGVELLNVGNEFVHLNGDPSFGACLFLWGEVCFVE